MATKKYLTKYARGSRQLPSVDGGLRAMQIQGDRQTKALANLRDQQRQADQSYITGIDRAAKLEEENRKLVRKVEVDIPEKLRADALRRNNEREQQDFKRQIDEQKKLADVWGALSPTLARSVGRAVGNATNYFQTEAGIAEYERRLKDGTIGSITKVHQKIKSDVDFLDMSQQQFKAVMSGLKTGNFDDKQLYGYLSGIDKLHNPVAKEIFYLQHVKQFDGFERDFKTFLDQNNIPLNKKTVVGLYQFRVHELMQQYGINPDSEIGLKLQNFYRQKGFAAENQLTLGADYEAATQTMAGFDEKVKAISLSNDSILSTPEFKESVYNRKNAEFVKVIAAVNSRPIQNRDGSYSQPIVPNTRANIIAWAESEMGNHNNFQEFLEHVMGVTPEHENGYLIPGAEKDIPSNRILAKFPYLRDELAEKYAKAFDKKQDTQEKLTRIKQRSEALKYQQRMDQGYYKENPDAFFEDWEATNGNSYAREIFAGSLGFKSDYINAETLDSAIVRAYKSGDTRLIYHAWAALPSNEAQAMTAGAIDKEGNPLALGTIYKDLSDLSAYLGVPMVELDTYLNERTDKIVKEVEKDGAIDKSSGPSASNLADYIRSDILARYANNREGTAKERFDKAKSDVDKELGYVNGVLSNFVNDYRGSGAYKQKRGKSGASNKVIFMRFAGENFGNITSFEIDATLGNTKRAQRLEGLVNLVEEDAKSLNPTISDSQIYSLLKTGNTTNPLLKHLLKESTLNGVKKEDFVNGIKDLAQTSARTKKSVMQWGGDKWCDRLLGPTATGLKSNDQEVLQVCVNAIEAQFDMPAWEFLYNAKNRQQLQN